MREKIKCLDGPMEDEEAQIDRRLFVLRNEILICDKEGNQYIYMITRTGLKFIRNG